MQMAFRTLISREPKDEGESVFNVFGEKGYNAFKGYRIDCPDGILGIPEQELVKGLLDGKNRGLDEPEGHYILGRRRQLFQHLVMKNKCLGGMFDDRASRPLDSSLNRQLQLLFAIFEEGREPKMDAHAIPQPELDEYVMLEPPEDWKVFCGYTEPLPGSDVIRQLEATEQSWRCISESFSQADFEVVSQFIEDLHAIRSHSQSN